MGILDTYESSRTDTGFRLRRIREGDSPPSMVRVYNSMSGNSRGVGLKNLPPLKIDFDAVDWWSKRLRLTWQSEIR